MLDDGDGDGDDEVPVTAPVAMEEVRRHAGPMRSLPSFPAFCLAEGGTDSPRF